MTTWSKRGGAIILHDRGWAYRWWKAGEAIGNPSVQFFSRKQPQCRVGIICHCELFFFAHEFLPTDTLLSVAPSK